MTAPPSYRPGPPAAVAANPRHRPGRARIVVLVAAVAVLVVLGALGLAWAHLSPTQTVDSASVQHEIVRITRDAVQVDAGDVRCPVGITAKAGATFTCTAMVEADPVITSDRLLRRDAVERAVATKMAADLHADITVRCGPSGRTVVSNTPGEDIDCTATKAGNRASAPLTVTVDEDGAATYRFA